MELPVTDHAPRPGAPATGVIVTGAASGIGRATAEALAAVGRPVALWDIDRARLMETADAIRDRHAGKVVIQCINLADPKAISEGVALTRSTMSSIGGVVHAAGTVEATGLDAMTIEKWDAGIAVHLRALALLARDARPDLARQPGSAIVAIASINATLGNGLVPIYSAAKGGMLSLVRSLADSLAQDGIRVNSVSPGMIETPMLNRSIPTAARPAVAGRILLGRLGLPHEVASLVRFLLSDEASYITASEFVVDGGTISSQRGG